MSVSNVEPHELKVTLAVNGMDTVNSTGSPWNEPLCSSPHEYVPSGWLGEGVDGWFVGEAVIGDVVGVSDSHKMLTIKVPLVSEEERKE